MKKFIIDTQLPPKLVRVLRKSGYNAIHTTHFPDGHLLKDSEIIDIAKQESRIVVTKDSDFFDNFLAKGSPPAVLLIQVGNIKNADLFQLVESNLPQIVQLFEQGIELVQFDRNSIMGY